MTLEAGNFAEMAHIVAFKTAGPRGTDGERPRDINNLANLMLLCRECHKLVDDKPKEYPRSRLEIMKRDHEARIALVTEFGPGQRTAVVTLGAPVGGHVVAIPEDHIRAAVAPRWPISRQATQIDLNALKGPREDPAFYESARRQVDRAVARLFEQGGEAAQTGHLSVFGFAPIPLLVYFGSALTNKIPTDVFQRHRDTEDWTWKIGGDPVAYQCELLSVGDGSGQVAILLELSGSISLDVLPPEWRGARLYKLGLEGRPPDPTFLRTKEDLNGFRTAFQQLLGLIGRECGAIEQLALFPAVPSPVAILCGRERLHKFHPAFRIYDFDRENGGYTFALDIG